MSRSFASELREIPCLSLARHPSPRDAVEARASPLGLPDPIVIQAAVPRGSAALLEVLVGRRRHEEVVERLISRTLGVANSDRFLGHAPGRLLLARFERVRVQGEECAG